MKNLEEKEKRLDSALSRLNGLKPSQDNLTEEMLTLENQKNQLEIEKEELEKKFLDLGKNHENLKNQLEKANLELKEKFQNQNKFFEKADELNQETENLIEEIDEWQT
jgi:5-formyltetrahydrofolate cyclo-ligase